MAAPRQAHRRSLWEYYDRRVTDRMPGLANAHGYWTGLGVAVGIGDIAAEADELVRRLWRLRAVRFVDVGAGPGTFTAAVPGSGLAIDQSLRALTALRGLVPGVPVVRADAFRLPLADRSMARFFTSHLYGLLLPEERRAFLDEAGRVAGEIVILDAGRPPGVAAEEWQERALPSGERYRVYRRHFDARSLAAEVEGDVLFAGRFYVLVARRPVRGRRA